MSRPKLSYNKSTKFPLLVFIALFLLILVILLGFFYYQQYQERKKLKENVNQQETLLNKPEVIANLDTNSPIYASDLPLVYSRSGEVTLVNAPDIYIKAKFRQGDQLVERVLKIVTDSETEFLKYNLEELINLGPERANEAKTIISIKDIEIGDQITAVSNENIKEATEFLATSIEKQI